MLTCGRDMTAVDIGGSFNDREHMEKSVVEAMLTSPQLWHSGKLKSERNDRILHQIRPTKSGNSMQLALDDSKLERGLISVKLKVEIGA